MDALEQLHPNGLFLRKEALDFGYRDRDLAAARHSGVLHRVRHGAYVSASTWGGLDEVERFRLRGRAVCLTHPGAVALSHASGAAEHGLRLWGADLSRVHVTRLDGAAGRVTPDIVHHEGTCRSDDVHTRGELSLLGVETCALGAASLGDVEAGLVTLDSALDGGAATEESLWTTYAHHMHRWPRTGKLQVTLRLMRPGAESVGESRVRFLCWTQHLPQPVLQYEVRDRHGILLGRVDLAWPDHRLLGEFDGRIKYDRLLRPGQNASDVVVAEKRREERLREATGWAVVRLMWDDLSRPTVTADRIRHLMAHPHPLSA